MTAGAARLRRTGAGVAALVVALTTVVALVAGAAPASAGQPAPAPATARYETRFMTQMVDHHGMAVQMAQLCTRKAVHEDLVDLCQEIISAQRTEIAQMQRWLQDWYGVRHAPQMSAADMRQMQRLERLSAADFEVAFLQMMTRHHRLAIVRAQGCLDRARHEALRDMCQDIITAQRAEIRQMQRWLCDWYGRCARGDYGGAQGATGGAQGHHGGAQRQHG